MVFHISHISVPEESAEGRDDERSLHEVSSEVFSAAEDAGEEDEGSGKEEESKDQEDQGEEFDMQYYFSVSNWDLKLCMSIS